MSRPNPFVLFGIIAAVVAIMAWFGASRGVLLIAGHEGDVYHLLDILGRMELGQRPHQDFVTPIGIASFLPIAYLQGRGFSVGEAILLSQVLFAVCLAVPLLYATATRLTRLTGCAFAAVTVIFVLALIYGGTDRGISVSMHYNRWAWAIANIVIVLALVPGRGWKAIDGVLLGLGLSAFVFLKITYFVALLPCVVLSLVLQRQLGTLLLAALTGCVVAVSATIAFGLEFWMSYIGDLLNVAGSDLRPHPGATFAEMVAHADMLAALAAALVAYVCISRSGNSKAAVSVLLFVAGGLYVTYQNFGNDPKWLVSLAAVVMALRPGTETEHDGPGLRTVMTGAALVMAAVYLPSAYTMAMSPVKHFAQDLENYGPMLPGRPGEETLLVRSDRALTLVAQVNIASEGSRWDAYYDPEDFAVNEVAGVEFPYCELFSGTFATLSEISTDIKSVGLGDAQFFVADSLVAYWLFGGGQPLRNGAPWYYSDLSGIENAEYLLIPKCAFVRSYQKRIIEEILQSGLTLSLAHETEIAAVFAVNR